MMKKIVVVGSLNVDTVVRVPHLPAAGETILSRSVSVCRGGKGANQAAAIAKLGGNVAMIGCVGNDSFGQFVVVGLKECGVDVGAVQTLADTDTGTAYINVADSGENNIVVNAGANNHLTVDMVDCCRHLFDDASHCVIQLETPIDTLYFVAQLCRRQNIRLILNPAPAAELNFAELQSTWMIAPNESELDLLVPGDGDVEFKAHKLFEKGFEHVLVTLGSQGCILLNAQGKQYFEACKVDHVKDTTAAGDSFIGALAFGLSLGHSLQSSIVLANKAASITVSRMGAQHSLPTMAELQSAFGPV